MQKHLTDYPHHIRFRLHALIPGGFAASDTWPFAHLQNSHGILQVKDMNCVLPILLLGYFGWLSVQCIGFRNPSQNFRGVRPAPVMGAFLRSAWLHRRLAALLTWPHWPCHAAQTADTTTSKGYISLILTFVYLLTDFDHDFCPMYVTSQFQLRDKLILEALLFLDFLINPIWSMISRRRWISWRTSFVDKPLGNLGKGDGFFILTPHK